MRRTQLKQDARDGVLTEIRSLKNAMVADETRPSHQDVCDRLDRILTMIERGGEEIEDVDDVEEIDDGQEDLAGLNDQLGSTDQPPVPMDPADPNRLPQ